MRWEIAHPCCAPSSSVRRIRRSRVPCGRSIRDSGICLSLFASTGDHTRVLVEVRGENQESSNCILRYCAAAFDHGGTIPFIRA